MKTSILIILILMSSSLFGQFDTGKDIHSFELGAILCTGTETSTKLNGYDFSYTYDYRPTTSAWSTGVSIAYMKTNEDLNQSNIEYSTVPVMLQAKWYFLPKSSMVYLQGGFGLHSSRVEVFGRNENSVIVSEAGILFMAGFGTFAEIGNDLFITAGYNFNWLDGKSYQNGIVHSFKIGLAFQ